MIEILVKEYGDGVFIVVTKDRSRVILKKEFDNSMTRAERQKYVFSLMEEIPESANEYVELRWVVDRRINMTDDPRILIHLD